MTRASTYYQVLGIGPDATPDQVRAAYLRLMKRHHPDKSAAAGDGGADEVAPLLNRCYATLRDSQSRAWYDAQLAGQSNVGAASVSAARGLVAYKASDNHRVRAWIMVMALLLSLLAVQLSKGWEPAQWLQRVGAIGRPALAAAAPLSPSANYWDVVRAARRAMAASPGEAEMVSTHCFAALRFKRSTRAGDLCVIFDDAFIYWHRNARGGQTLPLYFDDRMVRIRHMNALAGTGNDPEARLPVLRDLTFRVLLSEVAGRAEAPDPPVKPAA